MMSKSSSYFDYLYDNDGYFFTTSITYQLKQILSIISNEWWNSILSFIFGAITVGFIWVYQIWSQKTFELDQEIADDDNISWVEPWSNVFSVRPFVEDFTNRIGEIRGKITTRSRWPWETIRKRVSTYNNNNNNNPASGTDVQPPTQEVIATTVTDDYDDDLDDDDDDDYIYKNNRNRNSNAGGAFNTPRSSNSGGDGIGDRTTPNSLNDMQSKYRSDINRLDDGGGGGGVDDEDNDYGMFVLDSTEEYSAKNNKNTGTSESKSPPSPANKQICIGSIFGLDVGGTLAKLVYFEQKSVEYDPIMSPRERHYAQAASAQAVVMARRSYDTDEADVMQEGGGGGGGGNENQSIDSSSTNNNNNYDFPKIYHRRRRSVSVGCLGRRRQLQEERRQEKYRQQLLQQQKQRQRSNSIHSKASELDLRHLKELRQESVPDDLDQYRNCVHFQSAAPTTAAAWSAPTKTEEEEEEKKSNDNNNNNKTTMKKSRSMFDLSKSKQKAQALENFYSFARRLDSYHGSDNKLSFYSRELGGDFHFIHFETRRMENAMDLIRAHNLHASIAQMGATGGGAHKFATLWEQQLAISMVKQDELDSLVAGMQFVLSTVVGECYTFRPKKDNDDNSSRNSNISGNKKNVNTTNNNTQRTMSSLSTTSDGSEDTTNEVGAPLLDESSTDSDESNNHGRQQQQQHPTHNIPPPDPKINRQQSSDEWWWSRKVQRDAISYSSSYPYMLVTIGTGVSILRVDGPRQHERISGSTIGGGTYWGLIRLLTDVEDFDDVMRLAEKGDPSKVDMMVGDIYGKNNDALQKLGLPSHIVASSFGKLVAKPNPADGLKQEDLARALLLMVTNNIGQVAYLNAKLHKTPRIYFVGNFLRRNNISQRRLSYAIHYWSKGEMEALFLEHEGYFGALGAFILSQKIAHSESGFLQWKSNNNKNSISSSATDDGIGDSSSSDDDDEFVYNMNNGWTKRSPLDKHRRIESFHT